MSKPSEYKPEFCAIATEFIGRGHSTEALAAELGYSRRVIYNWIKEFEEFGEAVHRGQDARSRMIEALAVQKAKGGPGENAMIIFLLKNWAGMSDKQEMTGKDGSPLFLPPEILGKYNLNVVSDTSAKQDS